MGASLAAVVPVKNIDKAKHRLSPALSPAERRGLFRSMLEDVLSTLARVSELAGVYLVSRDQEAKALALQLGLAVLEEPANRGHSAAVTFGAQRLSGMGVEGLLTIPGDVPLVSTDEVTQVLAAHRSAPAVTIVPSGDELGSNAVACSPPDILSFGFGDNSFYPHLAQARERGVEPTIVRLPGLALDVDTPQDLARFAAQPSATRAYAFLAESGILARLKQCGVGVAEDG